MRKLFYINIAVLVAFSSCTKNIQDLNTNQKAAITVPAATVFLAGQKNLVDDLTSPSGSTDPFRNFAQTWTEITYTSEAQYILTQYNSPDNFWSQMYGGYSRGMCSAICTMPRRISGLRRRRRTF
ncbi:hypothetical protein ACQ86N_32660 [Puia sp. P3]|uniref:hypothetical protein n=1 Tax=Puia sp. P3 TaxID=3423952 RepID=UPI003D67F32D